MNETHSNHVSGSLELPEGDIDGDTTLTLSLQLVQDPCYSRTRLSKARNDGERLRRTILEGALAELSCFLLELFDGTLINTTALVDQVSSSGGLSGVDMSDDCGHQTRIGGLSKAQTETYRRR